MIDSEVASAMYELPYQLIFNRGNGGSGSMTPQAVYGGEMFTFPECGFTPLEHKTFAYWEMSGVDGTSNNETSNDVVNGIFYPDSTVKTASNCAVKNIITVTAHWKDTAIVTAAPIPKNLTYNGNAQELVTGGEAEIK